MLGMMSALLAAQAGTSALPPAGKWVVDFADTHCTLSRSFGAEASGVMLGLRPLPGNMGGDVILLSPRKVQGSSVGAGHVLVRPSGERFPLRWVSGPSSGGPGRATQMFIEGRFWDAISAAESLEFDTAGRPVALSTGVMARALATLKTCQDDLLRRWGADPSVPLVEAPDEVVHWFTPDDYPPVSFKKREEGRVVILASLDRAGEPTACRTVRSSGFERLDAATCALLMRRGRFDPAVEDGPATRWSVMAIRWDRPG